MPKKLTPADYEAFLVKDGRGFVALEPYAGRHTKIKHQCPINEDHKWSATPGHIKSGKGCRYCKKSKPRLTNADYEAFLVKDGRGFVALEPYTLANEKIMHQCPKSEDHKWSATPHKIKRGNGCPYCRPKLIGDAHRETHADYKSALIKDGRGYVALERYVNARTRISHQCPEGEDHKWSAVPDSIKRGIGCPHCDQLGTDANVFYIWENTDDAGVYKVGITSERCTYDRVTRCARKNGMTANVILKLSVPDARELERKALEIGEAVDYPSTIDGYTEFRRYTDQELDEVYRMAIHAA